MPPQFREATCFLTVMGLLASFDANKQNIYEANNEDRKQTTTDEYNYSKLSHEESDEEDDLILSEDKSNNVDYIVEYDENKGSLNIDWKFNFKDIKKDQIIEEKGYSYVINEESEAIILDYNEDIDKEKIEIPSILGENRVTMIYEEAFSGLKNASTVILPEGIETIGMDAFAYSENLQNINIPNTVFTIDSYAFDSCYNLNNIKIPASTINLGEGIFWDCISLKDITIDSNITELRYGLFAGCISLKDIQIPKSVTKICGEVFADCTSLIEVSIPYGVKEIEDGAFKFCDNLQKVVIPSSVENMDENVFEDSYEDITIYLKKYSYAQIYADENRLDYKYINEESLNNNESIENKEELEVIDTGKATTVLNIRSGPSVNRSKMKYLEKGEKVEIVEKYANGWYKIKYNDSYGYVLGAYISLDNVEVEAKSTGITTDNLNIRSGASINNKKIGCLQKGEMVEIVTELSNGWYKIKYDGFLGYVSGAYVGLNGDEGKVKATGKTTALLNVRYGASINNGRIGYLPKGVKVDIVTELTNGWYKIKYNESYGYVSGAYVSIEENEDEIKESGVTTDTLNIRYEASTNNDRIDYLEKGETVDVVKELSNGWYKIKNDESYGYVSGAYVELNEEVKAIGITTQALNVRYEASTNNIRRGYLSKGTKVEIVAELSNGWYKIKYKNSYGYVSGAYIEL